MSTSIEAIRLGLKAAAPCVYDLQVHGLEHVPAEGAAVLVANHVTYADSLLLAGLVDRPVRFLVYHRLYDQPALRWFFRTVRAIPVAPRSEDPARLETALAEAVQTLRDGDLLGIFPEGQLTRSGDLGPFRPGLQRILAEAPAPVVPIGLKGLWGSALSHAGGPPLSRLPPPKRRRVRVAVAPPLPPEGLDLERLRDVVARLAA